MHPEDGNIDFVAYYDVSGCGGKGNLCWNRTGTGDLTQPSKHNCFRCDSEASGSAIDNTDRTDLLFKDAYSFVGTLGIYRPYIELSLQTGVSRRL